MCGIAGIVYATAAAPIDRELLGRMTGVMRHRGPDAQGISLWPGAGFGHRRLSIIDLATGDQPIFNEDRTIAVNLVSEAESDINPKKDMHMHALKISFSDPDHIVQDWTSFEKGKESDHVVITLERKK